MDRSYNHIKHLVDNIKVVKNKTHRPGCHELELRLHQAHEKHGVNQLDDKQRHTGFDYCEYDMPKFGTRS